MLQTTSVLGCPCCTQVSFLAHVSHKCPRLPMLHTTNFLAFPCCTQVSWVAHVAHKKCPTLPADEFPLDCVMCGAVPNLFTCALNWSEEFWVWDSPWGDPMRLLGCYYIYKNQLTTMMPAVALVTVPCAWRRRGRCSSREWWKRRRLHGTVVAGRRSWWTGPGAIHTSQPAHRQLYA